MRELDNEREVIQRLQAGDLRAYEIVFRHFEQPLLGLGLRMLGRKEEAEDAVQITFIKLHRSLGKFQFGARFSTYLFRIMLNVCFDLLRKRKSERAQEMPERDFSYAPGVELRVQLEEAIRQLPERMRACFVMFALEEMKQEDIAAVLDLSVGAVKAQIFHAKQKLRALLADTPLEHEPSSRARRARNSPR